MMSRALTTRPPPRYIAIPGPPLRTSIPPQAAYARFATKLFPILLFLLTLMTIKQYLTSHRAPPVCNCSCLTPAPTAASKFTSKSLTYKVFPRKPWITETEQSAEVGMRVAWKGKVMNEQWEEVDVRGWFVVRKKRMEEDEEGRVKMSLEKGRVEVTKEEILKVMVQGGCEGLGVTLAKEGEGEEARWEFFYGC